MTNKNWAEDFFDKGFEETFRLLGKYETTEEDIKNLLILISLPAGSRILDVPCGWGRHSGVLSELGFQVTGVDSSPSQICRAKKLWPTVQFYKCDMREPPNHSYDAVFNLWTSFGSLPKQQDDIAALTRWNQVTNSGGILVMELTTREYAEESNRKNLESITQKTVISNGVREDASIDWIKGISTNTYTRENWSGTCITRLYDRDQIHHMLKISGYKSIQQFGSFDGGQVSNKNRTIFVAQK